MIDIQCSKELIHLKQGIISEFIIVSSISTDKDEFVSEGLRIRKRVSFDKISIRQYPIELGDNPSCSKGPPLTIGWISDEFVEIDIDDYELSRPPRLIGGQMIIGRTEREKILLHQGHHLSEIREVVEEINRCKRSAKITKSRLDEVSKTKNGKLKRFLKPRKYLRQHLEPKCDKP